jgi:choline dehydrogenase-like flavoprotein
MLHEADTLGHRGSRRVAIPFGEPKWEREREGTSDYPTYGRPHTPTLSPRDLGKGKGVSGSSSLVSSIASSIDIPDFPNPPPLLFKLSTEQLSLRETALMTVVQMIDSLEPLLKEASGKNQDDWDRWWSAMMIDFFRKNGVASGECLEIGAWWGQKI